MKVQSAIRKVSEKAMILLEQGVRRWWWSESFLEKKDFTYIFKDG